MAMSTYVIAVTGASGVAYAARLVNVMSSLDHQIRLLISRASEEVIFQELGLRLESDIDHKRRQLMAAWAPHASQSQLELFAPDNLTAPIASGSFPTQGMVVIPCSMGTLARIATGSSTNLIERAADIMLKERRPLILVPRETPLSDIHLGNMLSCLRAGAEIMPAMPAFYHHPEVIQDLVDFVVGRVLDRLGIGHDLFRRWGAPVPAYEE